MFTPFLHGLIWQLFNILNFEKFLFRLMLLKSIFLCSGTQASPGGQENYLH